MERRLTDEEIGKAIGVLAEKVKLEMDFELKVAKSEMMFAENELFLSLNEEQKKLFDIYRKRKEIFFDIAEQMYKRKI